jgi:hypothetical protein
VADYRFQDEVAEHLGINLREAVELERVLDVFLQAPDGRGRAVCVFRWHLAAARRTVGFVLSIQQNP